MKKKRSKLVPKASFSKGYLLAFILVFGAVGGYAIWKSLAAGSLTKTWNSQADFNTGTLSNTTATSGGSVTLTPSVGGGGAAVPLPTYNVHVPPYTADPNDPGQCLSSHWLLHTSPTTTDTRTGGTPSRYLHVSGSGSHDEWWGLHSFMVPTAGDWPADGWGNSILNWHNVAGDSGPVGSGGIGWGFGSGTSAILLYFQSLTHTGDNTGLHLHLQNAGPADAYLPNPVPGQWYDIVTHVIFGRTDGSTPRPGSIQVYVNGSDTPVVNLNNLNILQRATGPDGVSYVQQWVQFWEGGPYLQGEPCRHIGALDYHHNHVASRFGQTLAQAVGDTNITHQPQLDIPSLHESGYPDYGNSSATPIASRSTTDFKLPSSLASQAGLSGTTTYPSSGSITLTHDAGQTVDWNALTQTPATNPTGTNITYQVRTSADNTTWSTWGSIATAANSRYLQVQATLSTTNSAVTPSLDSLTLSYDPVTSPTAPTYLGSNIATGDTLSGTKTWTVSTSGPVASVEFWANGTKLNTDTTAPYSFNLDTTTLPNGSNQLGLNIFGTDGTKYTQGTGGVLATVTVNNTTPAPPPTPPPVKAGDINGDSKVDFLDLSILVKNYGQPGSRTTGDLNNDTKIDFLDLSVLVANWGK